MPESTYLQTILKSFATLDIGSLESILKREYSLPGHHSRDIPQGDGQDIQYA
jgi:hypothetical protein